MGCSSGKFHTRKIKDSPIFGVDDGKIQTILKLDPVDAKSHKRSSKDRKDGRRKRTSDPQAARKNAEIQRTPSKLRNDVKTTLAYDSKITAKYDVKAVIGKGSFSRVLRVENRISKQPYAMKVIETPSGREAFEAELSVLRRVNHPNVIKLIEVFESNHKVYMVMELATGGSLLDRLETKGYLPEDDSRNVIRMVLHGIKYLHVLGITHRDLKPDNLLYHHPGKDSKIMITDFSWSSTRRAIGNPYMHTVCSTPQYIAPEILTRKSYTCAIDIWAVGVITYIVLCGAFPFDSENDAHIFKYILRGRVQMNDPVWMGVSEESKSFILQLLQTDPVLRLDASEALHHPWFTSSSLTYPKVGECIDHHSIRSQHSMGSMSSSSSAHSLRLSGHRRIHIHQLEALFSNPELAAML